MNRSDYNDENEAAMYAMELAGGSVLPMVVKSVIELGIFDILARAAGSDLSGNDIASKLSTTNPRAGEMADRMMRFLACHSIVHCVVRNGDRFYALNSVSKYFTNNQDGVSFAPMCLMTQDKVSIQSWYHLKEAVLEGGVPFEKAFGMKSYEYNKTDPRFDMLFNRAMSNNSTVTMKTLVETYKGFGGLKTVVDVGGGNGALLAMVVANYPSITNAINFDLPHVIEKAPTHPSVEHVSGDMFVSVPAGDAIILKSVIHIWSDEQCLKLLKNCYKSVAEKGKVIVIETLIIESPETSSVAKKAARTDMMMLAHSPGGRLRTVNEYEALATASGFKRFQLASDAFYTNVMEFHKN